MKLTSVFIFLLGLPSIINDDNVVPVNCADIACADTSDPVCGFDGGCYQTFCNSCEMEKENCWRRNEKKFTLVKDKACSKCNKPKCPDCPIACNKDYIPICGYNGICTKTFSNYCSMQAANCDRDSSDFDYNPISFGECPDDLKEEDV